MQRRAFITVLGGVAAAWPLGARAQQPSMPVIGLLYAVSAEEWADRTAAMRQGLNESGFVEGRNVAIEYRWAGGRLDRLPAMAADLVGRKVAVILVGGSTVATQAAMAATKSIPIVFTAGVDPLIAGFVASLNKPGGNVTGVALVVGGELESKRLELLHELIPTAVKIALLVNPHNPVMSKFDSEGGQTAARRLGLDIIVVAGGTENEIEEAFAIAVQQRVAALQIGSDAFFQNQREQIAALALRHAMPTMSSTPEEATAGSLMSYGADPIEVYRQAGIYVGRILKGEKPADLPVVLPTKFKLTINLKTAKALGLTIPESFLLRADRVIE
jgi:putative tryptophan/tyrosine transport system substrate-binding protein